MGCAQSKIENEESVSRCKDRKLLMKQALAARNAFAAAHFAYAVALKNTGVALSGYAHGEAAAAAEAPEILSGPPLEAAAVPPPPPPPQEQQPLPPPPPLPSFSPSPASLQRSVTMPELPKRGVSRMGSISFPEDDAVLDEPTKNREIKENGGGSTPPTPPPPSMAWDYFHMNEEEDDDDEEEEEDEDNLDHHRHHPNSLHHLHHHNPHDLYLDHDNQNNGMNVSPMDFEFQTPEKPSKMEVVVEEEEEEEEGDMEMETPKPSHFTHSNTAPTDMRRANKMVNGSVSGRSSVNWYKVLKDIDDHFLKASECAQEVSRLLEANRYQYHYNFADTREPVDHAARVMRVITWNRPGVAGNGKDDYYGEENETHAIVLDKLLAWEKKLYDEVKAGELMKMEYQRKVALLTKQKKRGVSAESLEKTKAAVSHLHTRYIVDMQSMDSTVSEVNELRDRQLYPKLVELIDAMANMWESMSTHHDDQLKIVTDLRSLDIIVVYRETTRDHHDQTTEFLNVVEVWQQQFEKLAVNQKSYVRALHTWLKLNLIPIESTLKEKVSSPPRIQDPPIKSLIQSWYEFMEKLPEEMVLTSISSFVAVISTIRIHQEEEMKLKEKWEETNKEYIKRKHAFEEWLHKHNKRASRAHPGDMDDEAGPGDDMEVVDKDPVTDRRAMVESLKNRLDEEVEDHRKHCMQVREKSMGVGKAPPVIDAAELQKDPEGTLRGLCEDLDIPFQPSMLKWEAGPKAVDGVWAPWWYGNVHKSTCFSSPNKYPKAFPAPLYDLLEQSLPFYNYLRRHVKRSLSLLKSPLPEPSLPVPENAKLLAWVGDEILPRENAKVSVFDSVVQGGDSVWEGLRVYNGKIFKLEEHLDRMFDSAKALAFSNVPTRDEVKEAIFTTLIRNGMFDNAHIRLSLTRGKKVTSGMSPAFNLYGCTLIVLPEWKPPVYDNTKGIVLVTATTRRNSPNNLDSKIHHNNLLNNILAKIEGNNANADDAIMLDKDGYVSETNATNIFLVKRGKVITPHADYCLPGITRATVMDLVVKEGLVLEERRISLSEFHTADEVWTTGTMGELSPAVKIDGRLVGDGQVGPVTRRLQSVYKNLTSDSGVPIPTYQKP